MPRTDMHSAIRPATRRCYFVRTLALMAASPLSENVINTTSFGWMCALC